MVMMEMDMDLFEGLFGLFTNKIRWQQGLDIYRPSIVETPFSFYVIILIIIMLESVMNNKVLFWSWIPITFAASVDQAFGSASFERSFFIKYEEEEKDHVFLFVGLSWALGRIEIKMPYVTLYIDGSESLTKGPARIGGQDVQSWVLVSIPGDWEETCCIESRVRYSCFCLHVCINISAVAVAEKFSWRKQLRFKWNTSETLDEICKRITDSLQTKWLTKQTIMLWWLICI